jgi:RNA polymerase sigma-70 factor, ECF subfamily
MKSATTLDATTLPATALDPPAARDGLERQPDLNKLEAATDEELLLGYRCTHSEPMFAELLRRYERPLQRHLLRLLKSPTAVEDVLQNTFLLVHLRADRFDPARKVRPWLYSVASHQAIDYLRRNRRHQAVSLSRASEEHDGEGPLANAVSLANEDVCPAERLDAATKRAWVRRAVGELPQPYRQVLSRVHLDGCSYLEAAQELGVPLGTIKSRNHTGMTKLVGAWQRRRRQRTECN